MQIPAWLARLPVGLFGFPAAGLIPAPAVIVSIAVSAARLLQGRLIPPAVVQAGRA